VFAKQVGGDAVVFQPIARLQVVEADPTQVTLRTDGLYDAQNRQAFPLAETPAVASGALEGSNANLFSSLVDMISMSRRYEMQVKVLKQASDLAERSHSLARINQ
jgi:flagellar basal-body rod protein FlgF